MPGETNLSILLRQMQPRLNDGVYVFCSVPPGYDVSSEEVLAYFREKEGLSLILERSSAERRQLAYTFEAAWITLSVHSALAAVGLTAAVAKALAQRDISCNVVAAYYHDHIFVPHLQAGKAMEVLGDLTKES